MAESAKPHRHMSVEEYLDLEANSSVKHEYVAGIIHAQAGASDHHNRISGKIYRRLAEAAEGTPCRVYMSDMRLRASGDVFYYPDVMVACEPPEMENPTFRRDPCLVIEVISPSTAQTDRREKLTAYRNLPTLRSYLIVEQSEARIEHHFRDENDEWWWAELADEAEIPIPCPPDTRLSLEDIYEGI